MSEKFSNEIASLEFKFMDAERYANELKDYQPLAEITDEEIKLLKERSHFGEEVESSVLQARKFVEKLPNNTVQISTPNHLRSGYDELEGIDFSKVDLLPLVEYEMPFHQEDVPKYSPRVKNFKKGRDADKLLKTILATGLAVTVILIAMQINSCVRQANFDFSSDRGLESTIPTFKVPHTLRDDAIITIYGSGDERKELILAAGQQVQVTVTPDQIADVLCDTHTVEFPEPTREEAVLYFVNQSIHNPEHSHFDFDRLNEEQISNLTRLERAQGEHLQSIRKSYQELFAQLGDAKERLERAKGDKAIFHSDESIAQIQNEIDSILDNMIQFVYEDFGYEFGTHFILELPPVIKERIPEQNNSYTP